ncbi:hypothetical protein B0H12DRAFT_1269866 [Mycena haematopus]|nr:hypothetical protein B0H12DRAFT_1269866 [Mycena haematopus]
MNVGTRPGDLDRSANVLAYHSASGDEPFITMSSDEQESDSPGLIGLFAQELWPMQSSEIIATANPSDDLPVKPIHQQASRKASCNNAGGRRIQCTRPSLTRLSTIHTSFRRAAALYIRDSPRWLETPALGIRCKPHPLLQFRDNGGQHRTGNTELVISRAGGRTKSGRNGLGSDTGIKTEGVKVQDGNMVNLCDTTQVDEEGVGNHSDDGRRSWWMPKGGRRKAEPREVKGQTPIDAGGRRAAKGGSPEDEWWRI